MNTGPDLLSQLKDLHDPAPIGWWPWAPGWYLLCLLTLLVLFYLSYLMSKRLQRGRARRHALKELERLERRYEQQGGPVPEIAMQIAVLLKKVALSYYPRQSVASLEGEAWLAFLDAHAKKTAFVEQGHLLIHAPYQAASEHALEPLFVMAKAWISERGR